MTRYEGAKKVFLPEGDPLDVGQILKQPELAQTLQKISVEGASAFYTGKNAQDIVKVLNQSGNPSTVKDFSNYEPQ